MPKQIATEIAQEPKAVVPLTVLRWWRELVDLNPSDLAPRFDALIARLEREPDQ